MSSVDGRGGSAAGRGARRRASFEFSGFCFVEVIMLRVFVSATMFLVLILAAPAGGQPESNVKEFAKDLEQLNGSWMSPKIEFAPGVTGRCELKLEFKTDSTVGQAVVLNFVS